MMSAVIDTIGGWMIAFGVIAGLGMLVRQFGLGVRTRDFDGWFEAFWLGYAVLIAALQIWHLVLPIDWRASLIVTVVGVVGLVAWVRTGDYIGSPLPRTGLNRSVPKWSPVSPILYLLALSPIALWIANRALSGQMDFDSGFYHLSSIRWLNDYPIVPGLGNLHYRFAFNQSFFLFVAALNVYPIFDQGFHLANSLLLIVAIAQCLALALKVLRAPKEVSPYRLFATFCLPILVYRAIYSPFSADISSPSPDLCIFVLQMVLALAFIRYVYEPFADEKSERLTVVFILTLAVVGVTSKLSFAAFGTSVMLLTLMVWLVRHRDPGKRRAAITFAARALIGVGLVLGGVWMARGAILSGYPLFPSSLGALPVDYRVPPAIRREAELWVYSFARQPGGDMDTVLGNWNWVNGWFARMHADLGPYLFLIPFYVTLGSWFAALILAAPRYLKRLLHHAPPLIPPAAAAIFWFLSAPDPRFIGSAFWILALWGMVLCLVELARIFPKNVPTSLIRVIPLGALVSAWLIVAGGYPDALRLDLDFPALPVTPIRVYETATGLRVNVSGDPNNTMLLWDMPPPASPYLLPLLEARGNALRDGFRMRDDATLNPPGT